MSFIIKVVMINDGSTRDYIINGTIDTYIERFNGIVKIFHNDKREGLIRARTIGAKRSTGSVLVYLGLLNIDHMVPLQRLNFNPWRDTCNKQAF